MNMMSKLKKKKQRLVRIHTSQNLVGYWNQDNKFIFHLLYYQFFTNILHGSHLSGGSYFRMQGFFLKS